MISHDFPDGRERAIMGLCISYLVIHNAKLCLDRKRSPLLVYGIQHFDQYLYGRLFTLITDRKPLLATAQMQICALLLSVYWYMIEFKRIQDHANADELSRVPLQAHNLLIVYPLTLLPSSQTQPTSTPTYLIVA